MSVRCSQSRNRYPTRSLKPAYKPGAETNVRTAVTQADKAVDPYDITAIEDVKEAEIPFQGIFKAGERRCLSLEGGIEVGAGESPLAGAVAKRNKTA